MAWAVVLAWVLGKFLGFSCGRAYVAGSRFWLLSSPFRRFHEDPGGSLLIEACN